MHMFTFTSGVFSYVNIYMYTHLCYVCMHIYECVGEQGEEICLTAQICCHLLHLFCSNRVFMYVCAHRVGEREGARHRPIAKQKTRKKDHKREPDFLR